MSRSRYHFQPEMHESRLQDLIEELLAASTLDPEGYERVVRRHPKAAGGFFSKSEIIRGFRHLNRKLGWDLDERPIVARLRMKPIRTQSGVAPVTVLTKPYPCPGRCIFCPSDVRMPKSYLASEPGAQRAAQHRFDPYSQSLSRLATYHNIGHDIDKIELIILGGTWSSYPEPYQVWFVSRCLQAMNHLSETDPPHLDPERTPPPAAFVPPAVTIDGRHGDQTYNQVIRDHLERQAPRETAPESASWSDLERIQTDNESAVARCVGLVVETRPDHLDLAETLRMRRLGATKVQIGYQSLSDEVLRLNHRGHDVAAIRRAMALLRQAGFKIHAHWMPNLYGSNPTRDLEDFDRIFDDPDFRPDELKIYPCSLVETAELMAYHADGRWQPYSTPELLELVAECIARTPPYCRLTRVVRDIPGTDIIDGSRVTNLREVAERRLAERGIEPREIRSREIRHRSIDDRQLHLDSLEYTTGIGREIFLQYVTDTGRIAAFLRLSLPDRKVEIPEISASAMIREIHVYGVVASLGESLPGQAQHQGLGRRLIEEAERLAGRAGFTDLAVISAIGTRNYYRAQGFVDGDLYQHRPVR